MHVGMELAQKADFSVELTQAEFTRQLKLLATSPALWKRRQSALSDEENRSVNVRWGNCVGLRRSRGLISVPVWRNWHPKSMTCKAVTFIV